MKPKQTFSHRVFKTLLKFQNWGTKLTDQHTTHTTNKEKNSRFSLLVSECGRRRKTALSLGHVCESRRVNLAELLHFSSCFGNRVDGYSLLFGGDCKAEDF